jgi:MFS transporter, DHA2 family, methylenomycin A resistance protein
MLCMVTSSPALSHIPAGVDRPNRAALGLAAICLGFLMITLDATIVNVALRPIVDDLGGSVSAAQWIVNGYTLAFAVFLLSAGALADRLGARRGYLIGLIVFGAGSAVCCTAQTMGMLIVARIVQGMGAAWLMPCSLALIAHMFPETHARRRALAIWAGLSGVGLASGPVLGGVLTAAVGWRAIFLVNVPVAALALVLLTRNVAETRRHRHPLDFVGQSLAVVTLSLVTAGSIVAGQRGWGSALAVTLIGGGIAAGIAFVVAQHRVRHPMVDPVLFERPAFSLSVTVGLLFNFCLYGGLFCLAIELADAHRLSPFATGLAMLPMTVLIGLTAFLSGGIVARVGEWRAIAVGMIAGVSGALLVALNPTHGPTWLLVVSTLPLGLVSMAMAAMTAKAMSGVPSPRVGLASGVLNTARQTGGALGVGVLGALLRVTGTLSLHVAFAAIALAYGIGLILAVRGSRLNPVADA